MLKETLFDCLATLKAKFKSMFTQKKKLQALENYAEVANFPHKAYLPLIKKCIGDGFLDEKEDAFLSHLVEKYEVNYLDWSHRTKWLKAEMHRMAGPRREREAKEAKPVMDEFKAKYSDYHIPFELLAQVQKQQMGRRV